MRRTILIFLVCACGEAGVQQHPTSAAIPRLRATAGESKEQGGVVVAVEAVTSYNWQKYPAIVAHLAVEVRNENQVHGMGGEVSTVAMTTRYDDVPLVSLPAFEVRVINHSGHALKFDAAKMLLEDDAHAVTALSREDVRGFLDDELRVKENMQGRKLNQDQVQLVRASVGDLPLYQSDRVIPDGGEWQGFVSFRFGSEQTIDHVVLHLQGMKLDDAQAPDFKFPFMVERRHAARACKDGSQASPLGACPGDDEEMSPAQDGPCIQKTKEPQTQMRMQWWVGATAIADSDLVRTLLAEPSSRKVVKRGEIYRGVGYGLIMAGIALSAVAAVTIGRELGADKGPAGVSFLGLSVVGGGLAWRGTKRTEDAVRVYNEQADAGGACSVVW